MSLLVINEFNFSIIIINPPPPPMCDLFFSVVIFFGLTVDHQYAIEFNSKHTNKTTTTTKKNHYF